MLKKYRFIVEESLDGGRLDQVLFTLFSQSDFPLSRGKVRKLIIAGAVQLNGGRVRIASKTCRKGAKLEVFVRTDSMQSVKEQHSTFLAFDPSWLIFEDDFILGVNKPAGLPTQPTLDEARANLFKLLERYLQKRDGREAYVGLHHRLDRDTSGVMVFTKKKEANRNIGSAFQEHLAQKTYHALVSYDFKQFPGGLPSEWKIENYLAREKGKGGRMGSVRSGGDPACTYFRTLAQNKEGVALIEAKPKTGRMHQIRVHLSEWGAPILGDLTYGGKNFFSPCGKIPRVMLHAATLTFPHPITRIEVTLNAPYPQDFETCLAQLAFGNGPRS